jgi:SAM-dependent methyltransferase
MRVLDVGSGNGDVAFLAASFVGESGEVLGIDRSPAAVEAANSRARSAGVDNVTFTGGDLTNTPFETTFDAVVGRLVLMYQPDPVATLRALASCLRPGGIMAFQEIDLDFAKCCPASPVFYQALTWVNATLEGTGAHLRMGSQLYSAFVAAGLPEPAMSMESCIGGGRNAPALLLVPDLVQSLLPAIERLGIATAAQVQIDTLGERLRAEIVVLGAVTICPTLVGAWAKRPDDAFIPFAEVLGQVPRCGANAGFC